jgi:hypothetical protein
MNRQPENAPAQINLSATGEAECTLRAIAGLPAPEGLETRVKAALQRMPAHGKAATLLDWPAGAHSTWLHSTLARSAAAAAIMCVVVGGSWGVYQHVQPRVATIALPHVGASGGFSSANAMRTPKTLDGPVLTHLVLTHPAKGANGEAVGTDKAAKDVKKKSAQLGKAGVAKPAAQ